MSMHVWVSARLKHSEKAGRRLKAPLLRENKNQFISHSTRMCCIVLMSRFDWIESIQKSLPANCWKLCQVTRYGELVASQTFLKIPLNKAV